MIEKFEGAHCVHCNHWLVVYHDNTGGYDMRRINPKTPPDRVHGIKDPTADRVFALLCTCGHFAVVSPA